MKYFGTDGFRGKVNEVLTVDHAIKIGKFLGYYYSKKSENARCVIGKDTRRSGYMFEYALVAGLTSTGCDVDLLHVTTTPSVSYITRTEKYDFGIMITASHNPFYDNGIKIIDGDGMKMSEEVLMQCEDYIDGITTVELAENEAVGRAQDYMQGRNHYMNYLTTTINESMRGYKVGLDCANGASFMIAKSVFDMLGADTFVINNQPDGFNINRNCGSTHIEELQKYVRQNRLDVGFSFDGDADRCLAVDENGNLVDGDMIIYILGCFLKQQNALKDNTVVTTIMSNLGITKALERQGIKNVQTKVGDKYVSEEMNAHGYNIGGEQSGHVIISKYATTGDGVLTALQVMSILIQRKCPLSALVNDVSLYPQVLINVTVADPDAALEAQSVKDCVRVCEEKMGDTGRVVLRKSGTEPLVRVMVECEDDALCKQYANEIKNAVVNA